MIQQKEPVPSSYAEQLADYIVSFSLGLTPTYVVDHARYLLLDLLGAALAGVDTPEAKAAIKAVASIEPLKATLTLLLAPHRIHYHLESLWTSSCLLQPEPYPLSNAKHCRKKFSPFTTFLMYLR